MSLPEWGLSPDEGPDVIDLARALIAAPSPNLPGDETAVAAVIHGLLEELDLPPAQLIAEKPERPNLLTTLDFGPGGRHLVLCGHIDTKPIGDAAWSIDPFAGDIDGDRLYGLGSADMKAAVAAMLVAARRLATHPPASGKVSLLFLADEEFGARYGAEYVASNMHLAADAVVIGEPGGIEDDYDRLHLVSRGLGRFRLTSAARQGHSSLSGINNSRNAGVDVARLVVAVAEELRLAEPRNDGDLLHWETTINPALRYTGGVGYGVLPGRIVAETEVRTLPGADREAMLVAFRKVAERVAQDHGAELRVDMGNASTDWITPTTVPPDHGIVAAAQRATRAVLGNEPPLAVFPGTTDATWFDSIQGLPCLPALGPGLLKRCHAADEWVSVAAARDAVDLYTYLATDFCNPMNEDMP
jgi:succinyl-diaminopimelate desuccinylase